MFQRSACDTKTIASPLMSVEITEINKSTQTSAHCQTTTAMFDLHGFGGGIYLCGALMWHTRGREIRHTVPSKSGFG